MDEKFDRSIYEDSISLICGKLLGQGISRSVYQFNFDDTKVVKIERPGFFQNVIEAEIWSQIASNKAYSKWFAPCSYLSLNGRILIQDKCENIDSLPDKVPNILCDLALDNWGKLPNGKIVVRDYGVNDIIPRLMHDHKSPVLEDVDNLDQLENESLTLQDHLPNGESI